ncbi:hypothetical protein [Metabacillus sp. B2-18]|uniref:hypothetical protein n=1 Tax=Metabacillus sp. B2-18 TaxID=2897333 RepID=UPI001E344DEB|nr:hypothetical protein [Metabacillus sp. B2-18]UGB30433.1 hypothetical protein LPC09_22495 [Metabacillus sp. B2-18]
MEKIVFETIQSLKEYLPRMINGCNEIVEYLQEGNEGTALSQMPDFVEGLQWIFAAINGIQNNGHLQEIELISLKDNFKEVVDSLEMRDYVLLADLLDYEIAPVLKQWQLTINKVES